MDGEAVVYPILSSARCGPPLRVAFLAPSELLTPRWSLLLGSVNLHVPTHLTGMSYKRKDGGSPRPPGESYLSLPLGTKIKGGRKHAIVQRASPAAAGIIRLSRPLLSGQFPVAASLDDVSQAHAHELSPCSETARLITKSASTHTKHACGGKTRSTLKGREVVAIWHSPPRTELATLATC